MQGEEANRLKELEKENARLKRMVADIMLDKDIYHGAGKGKLLSPARRRDAVVHLEWNFRFPSAGYAL